MVVGMKPKRIHICLVPAADDAALNSPEYQAELETFDRTLRSHGIVPHRLLERLEAAAGGGEPAVWLSQFVIIAKALTPIICAAICSAIGGYFHAKRGRRVTFEIGKEGRIKGSAQTVQDADELLNRLLAEDLKQLPQRAARKKSGNKRPKGKTRG